MSIVSLNDFITELSKEKLICFFFYSATNLDKVVQSVKTKKNTKKYYLLYLKKYRLFKIY